MARSLSSPPPNDLKYKYNRPVFLCFCFFMLLVDYYLYFWGRVVMEENIWAVAGDLSYDQNTVLIDGGYIFLSFSRHHQLYWYLIMKGKVRHQLHHPTTLYKIKY